MFKSLCVAVLSTHLMACAQPPAATAAPRAPFIGVDYSKLAPGHAEILTQASEDFVAVAAGKVPIHAVLDAGAAVPSDGGTRFYKGNGYDLSVLKSLSSFGDFRGVAYGPVITFHPPFAPGNYQQISDVRIYSREELRKLLQ